jgi:bifunctional non-homologous end joining protein LigD
LRANKVFVDWSQNDDHKTTVSVYSLRARELPTVSTPVTWKDVETCLKKGNPELLAFTSDQVPERVEKMGDLFEPVLKLKQKLPPIEALEEFSAEAMPKVTGTTKAKVQNISSVAKPRKSIRRSSARNA